MMESIYDQVASVLPRKKAESRSTAADLGLLALRLTTGGLMAGHGAQKLFGSFGGHGIEGTAGWLESLGLQPGKRWAALAGVSELGSGLLTALGFLGPIGPIATFGPMIMAWLTAHAGKPIWVTSGGAELPLVNLGTATALALGGPGRYSLDKALGVKVPAALAALTAAGVAAGVAAGYLMREQQGQQAPAEQGGEQARPHMEQQTGPAMSADREDAEQLQAHELGGASTPSTAQQTGPAMSADPADIEHLKERELGGASA